MDFILRLALVATTATAYTREGPLYELTSANFDQFLSEYRNDLRVILFYSPFILPTTTSYSTEYFSAAHSLSDQIRFAKINIHNESNSEIKKRFSKQKIPFILYCRGVTDKCEEYKDEITTNKLKNFFKSKVYELKVLSNYENLPEIEKRFENSAVVLGVFEEFSGEKHQLFINFTYHFIGEYQFFIVKDDGQFARRFGLNGDSIAVVYGDNLKTAFYPAHWVLSNYKSEQDIKRFLEWTLHPLVAFMDYLTIKNFNSAQVPLGVLYLNTEKYSSNIPFFVQKLTENSKNKIASLYEPKKYQLTLANIKDFHYELSNLGLSGVDMVFLLHFQGKVYKVDKPCFYDSEVFIDDCFTTFYTQFDLQELPEYLKSDPVPSINYDKGVRVAVAHNFLSLIENKDSIHAVYVYTPSQKDYRKKLSTVESMTNHYKKDYRIDFIKINADTNTVPNEFQVSDKGRLFIVSKKHKKFVELKTDWDYMKIHGFINTHLESKKTDL